MQKLIKMGLILLIFFAGLTACDEFVLYDAIQPATFRLPVSIYPVATAIFIYETKNFTAAGGTEEYVFEVNGTGTGSINPASGIYTAPSTPGTYTITVTDTLGDSANATVYVMDYENLSIYPATVTMYTGETQVFTAFGGTPFGSPPPYLFSVIPGTGTGTIDAGGLFTADTAGTATVRVVDDDGTQRDASVSMVTPGSLILSPDSPVIDENSTVQFSGSGGVLPYTFAIDAGSGTIVGGLYSPAAGEVGIDKATVSLTDSDSPATIVTTNVTVLPAAPTDLVADGKGATAMGPQDIEVRWTDNSSVETEYRVTRIEVITGSRTPFTVAANTELYTDTGLSPSTYYYYEVVAVSGTLESDPPSISPPAEPNP